MQGHVQRKKEIDIKGTVSRELSHRLLYIFQKLFSRPIIASLKNFNFIKGTVCNVHKTVQRKLSWVILLCSNHRAGGVQFLSPGCDMYTFEDVGG